jgi:adenosylcobinamide kinase/adenosylcobinamide-phosphate guanylyltransferase
MTLPNLTLILGGARSGKSRRAQVMAEDSRRQPVMIATAQAFDDEMRDRITRHQAERGHGWVTIEAPVDLPEAIALAGLAATSVIVVDCLTLWVTNLLMADIDIATASDRLIAACRASPHPVILVSNETGFGIVPPDPLSRRFRDETGRLHQLIAAAADEVTLMVAGLPLTVKSVTAG